MVCLEICSTVCLPSSFLVFGLLGLKFFVITMGFWVFSIALKLIFESAAADTLSLSSLYFQSII